MYVGEKDTLLDKCKVQRCEKDVNPCIPNNPTKLVKMDTVNVDWKTDITFFLEIYFYSYKTTSYNLDRKLAH